jgi:hypothetical protein
MQLFMQFVPVSSDWSLARTTPEPPVDIAETLFIAAKIKQVVHL